MKLITELRTGLEHGDDDLGEFGELLQFAAFVYDSSDESVGLPFESYNMDGSVGFYDTLENAQKAFDVAKANLQSIEESALNPSHDDEEAMVGLFNTPKGFMVIAATTCMGYEHGLEDTNPVHYADCPHIDWSRILWEVFEEDTEEDG